MVVLNLTEKGGEPKQLTFDKDEVTVGRVQGNDIVLPKGNVSKRHCRIFVKDGRFAVEDSKSTNGTYVNGRKIPDVTPIFSADKIYVGDFVIRVENAPSQEAANLGNEAGSLSTALGGGRRPPPPPPRASQSLRAAAPEGDAPAPEPRRTLSRPPAPPPPPPPRREAKTVPPGAPHDDALGGNGLGDSGLAGLGGLGGLDDGLGEDVLATAPPRPTPAPPRPFTPSALDDSDADARPERRTEVPPSRPPARPRAEPSRADMPEVRERSNGVAAQRGGDPSGWLRHLVDDETVSGVFIAGADRVEVERGGRREALGLGAPERQALGATLRTLAAEAGANGEEPIVDITTPAGTRLTAIFPPVASDVCATIRKRSRPDRTFADLVGENALSREMREILEAALGARANILFTGDRRATAALLDAAANAIPARRHVLALQGTVGAPLSGQAADKSWVAVTLDPQDSGLIHALAALRPDHLVVDLAEAPIAADLIAESAYGQEGVIAALPARSAADALVRLESLAEGQGAQSGTRALIASTIDLVVSAVTLADGRLLVLELAEPRVDAQGRLGAEALATFKVEGVTEGRPTGRFAPGSGASRLAGTLAARGAAVSANALRR